MTSSPLLTRVAESTVIFCPITQFGCFRVSSKVTCSRSARFLPRKGPPDAVIRSLCTSSLCSPFRDWKIALCSLSTGRIFTPYSSAIGMIRCPAVTRVSLFASAMSLPARIASIVGRIPSIPTIAVTRISVSGIAASSKSPSMPATTFVSVSWIFCARSLAAFSSQTATSFGENSLICSSSFAIFRPALIPRTSISPFARTTSSVCVPIEPVEPNIAIFFIKTEFLHSSEFYKPRIIFAR